MCSEQGEGGKAATIHLWQRPNRMFLYCTYVYNGNVYFLEYLARSIMVYFLILLGVLKRLDWLLDFISYLRNVAYKSTPLQNVLLSKVENIYIGTVYIMM